MLEEHVDNHELLNKLLMLMCKALCCLGKDLNFSLSQVLFH